MTARFFSPSDALTADEETLLPVRLRKRLDPKEFLRSKTAPTTSRNAPSREREIGVISFRGDGSSGS